MDAFLLLARLRIFSALLAATVIALRHAYLSIFFHDGLVSVDRADGREFSVRRRKCILFFLLCVSPRFSDRTTGFFRMAAAEELKHDDARRTGRQ